MAISGRYAECRSRIKTGDIIYFSGGTSIASRLTQMVTKSPYFHVGMAFWIRDPMYASRLMIVEAHSGGRRIVSLSSYVGYGMSVLSFDNKWAVMADTLLDNTGAIPYSYFNYVGIGLKELFGVKQFMLDEIRVLRGQVCSELVSEYLQGCGISVSNMSSPCTQI